LIIIAIDYKIKPMVDLCVFILVGYLTVSGLSKGVIRIILELAILCLCIVISYFAYKITQNFMISTITLIVSSLTFSILIKLFFKSLKRRHKGRFREISFLNSLSGGIVGLVWGLFWAVVILFVIDIVPEEIPRISPVKRVVRDSKSFQVVRALAKKYQTTSIINGLYYLSKIVSDEEQLNNLRKHEGFQKLLKNEKLQAIISDEEMLQHIRNRDIAKIMNDPKFIALLGDLKLMQQFMSIDFKKVVESSSSVSKHNHPE